MALDNATMRAAREAFEKSRGMDDPNRYHPSPILPNGEYRLTSHCFEWQAFTEGADWALSSRAPYIKNASQTGVGEWCAPGPASTQKRQWMLVFEDKDMGVAIFDDEAAAYESFARHEAGGWNCHLFQHAPRPGQNANQTANVESSAGATS